MALWQRTEPPLWWWSSAAWPLRRWPEATWGARPLQRQLRTAWGRGPSGGGLGGVVGIPSDSGSVRHGALLPAPVEGRRSGAGNAGSSGEEVDPVRWKAADLGPVRPDPVAGRWIRRRRPLDGFSRPVDGLGGPIHGFFHFFYFINCAGQLGLPR